MAKCGCVRATTEQCHHNAHCGGHMREPKWVPGWPEEERGEDPRLMVIPCHYCYCYFSVRVCIMTRIARVYCEKSFIL